MAQLIIAEKPAAAERIAAALADKSPKKKILNNVPYYELDYNKKKIYVVSALGHLYTITGLKKGWDYPVFDIEWKPIGEIRKESKTTLSFIDLIKKLSKQVTSFIVATDYDIEGEVIGWNVLRFACNQKDASRMKFSTLTKEELRESYENASKHLDWGQAKAGEARHILDWYWGINTSKALTRAVKKAGRFAILSTGRVQGPALNIVVEREKEIKAFIPKPFWTIALNTNKLSALHKKGKFWEKPTKIISKVKDKPAIVSGIQQKEFYQNPPTPFDLTSLQLESYKTIGMLPKETQAIAQQLYIKGLISYPRTSSQKLPASLNYKSLMQKIAKQKQYKLLAEQLLKSALKPNEGAKTDPAHPAIYPTGEIPKGITKRSSQLYDLIVSRFLATFAEKAKRATTTVEINVNDEIFIKQVTNTLEKGWHIFYSNYLGYKEEKMPELKKGEILKVKEIKLNEDQTKPPKRYTPASIIKILESKTLGTKATRSHIVDTLYQRSYIKEKSIEATDLGIKLIETLKKYCPEIIDEQLTRHFEEEMNEIIENKKKEEEIIEESKDFLIKIYDKFKKNEGKIGESLLEAITITKNLENTLGKCIVCKKGDLKILYSRKTKKHFVACSAYPECKTTYSLPHGLIKPTGKSCKFCNTPLIKVIRAGKRPFEMCLTYDCESKKAWKKKTKEVK